VALIFTLLIMLVLTVIGSAALMTSQVDLKVSGTTKVMREAFYLSDGGIQLTPKVIDQIITDRTLPSFAATPTLIYDGVLLDDDNSPSGYVTDTSQSVTLVDKVMDYSKSDDESDDAGDIRVRSGLQGRVLIDVSRTRTAYLSGGGTEFASGTEGVGIGGATNTAVYFSFDSSGAKPTAQSQVSAQYRKVIGIAGGR